jgi:outer membrane lipoprotein-sorting protein
VSARRLLSSFALALCLAGCATGAPRPEPPLSDDARRLIALLTLRRDQFSDLRALVDLTVRRREVTQRFTGVVLAKPPASLRFEALSPFSQPVFLLTLSDGALTTYNVGDNHALSGPANSRTTGRWLGVPLEAEDVVALLIGRVLPTRDVRQAEILPADATGPSLRLVGKERSERIWMDFGTGDVVRAEIGGGRTVLVVEYVWAAGDSLPTGIRATAGPDFEAIVRYRQPVLATGVDPERFRLPLPEGANLQRFH